MSMSLASCAYVEFSRKYEVSSSADDIKPEKIEIVLERFFKEKGLKLIKKYKIMHPKIERHLVFEIPREKEEKRRDPYLRVTVLMNNSLIMEHREWFLSVNPIPSMEPHLPNDYIAPLQQEIEAEMKNNLGVEVKVSFISKSYY